MKIQAEYSYNDQLMAGVSKDQFKARIKRDLAIKIGLEIMEVIDMEVIDIAGPYPIKKYRMELVVLKDYKGLKEYMETIETMYRLSKDSLRLIYDYILNKL